MIRFKRTKCKCKECPLDGQKKVLGIAKMDKVPIAIIGEAPGELEDAQGEPFVGASGAKLKEAVAQAGIMWHSTYKTNVVLCRPPKNEIDSVEGQMALECCLPGFEEEVQWLQTTGVKVVIPTGNTAMSALGIQGKIGKSRGSVYEVGKMVAVPTYHPSFILRGMWKEEPTWIGDFMKARELSLKKWRAPKENFNLFPSVEDVERFMKDALQRKTLIGVDIETTSLSAEYSRILMIGLASSSEDVLVVPFLKQGGVPYWKAGETKRVWNAVGKLLKHGRLVFQNAAFDTWHLEVHGFPVGDVTEDTLLLHHCISPELPHNLGYIVSVYGSTPYWKDVVLGSADRMIEMDDKEVRTYNARDCAVLLQVLSEMHKHLKEVGTERTYREVSLKLIKPLRKMSMYGLPLDQTKIRSKGRLFSKKRDKALAELKEITGVPDEFNFGSGDHLRLLLWGQTPKSAAKVYAEKRAIDEDPKRRKDTKKYRELQARVRLYEETRPLYRVGITPQRTDAGSISVDGEALISIERAAIRRLEAIEDIRKKTSKHEEEVKEIGRLRDFLRVYREYEKFDKLASTFTGFPVGKDGRVHPSYKIHGTATGRLSSSDPKRHWGLVA